MSGDDVIVVDGSNVAYTESSKKGGAKVSNLAPLYLPDGTELARQMAAGERTAEAVVRQYLQRLETNHPRINAAVQVFSEAALAAAQNPRPGPLSGLPVSVKETFGIKGETITVGSKRMPPIQVSEDSEIVRRLQQAGAIIIARSNLPEFALTYESDNLLYGRTNNPLNPAYSPGGSSGGEAALVASGSSVLGVGSDIGGSIRYPAHCCGVVGFKPYAGAVDKRGTWPEVDHFVDSMLSLGPITRSVRDARLVYHVIANEPLPAQQDVAGLRLVVPRTFRMKVKQPAITSALQRARRGLRKAGMVVEEVDITDAGPLYLDYVALIVHAFEGPMHDLLVTADGQELSMVAEFGRQLIGRPTVHKYPFRMLAAMPIVRPGQEEAEAIIDRIKAARNKYHQMLGQEGILILPTSASLAMKHGRAAAYINLPGVRPLFTPTVFINTLNLSAISVPSWLDIDRKTGLVPGVMLACAPGAEGALLDTAAALEKAIA
jgi:Asp-tRNA(Asn)/Glu-tRNA(Gln) amidotransferase A subunit family amidase